MAIIQIDPVTDLLWQQLIENYKSDVFHSSGWLRVIAETYDFDMQAIILLDDMGRPEAGIPFCQIKDIRGKRIVSIPFSDYCDPLVANIEQWNCLITSLLEANCSLTFRCLHNEVPLADRRFNLVNRAKWHKLDLRPDLDTLWMSLHSSARRAIRKAEKDGIAVRIARDKKELRKFFEMHLGIRKYKYHLVAQPYIFFENIWHQFVEKGKGLLLLAVYQQEIIGAIFFLGWHDRLYYKFNASTGKQLAHRPNDLMIWEGIKYAQAEGYTYLDFGLSDWDQEGLVRYKRKFASDEKTISFLQYAVDEGTTEAAKQLGQLLPQLTTLFTDETVPDRITEKAGEILYRFFI